MTRIITGLIAAACMVACTPATPVGNSPAPSSVGVVTLTGQRGFAVAELTYITAAKTAGVAVDAGLIKGSDAVWLREKNARARKLLIDGKAATDGVTKAAAAAELFDIAGRIDAITGRK